MVQKFKTLEEAIIFATQKHLGQFDKAGAIYILHPLRVMLDPTLTTDQERITAILHDVLEDCNVESEELINLGYDPEVVRALQYLTKTEKEEGDYDAFIERIRTGPLISRKVKMADLKDNRDLTRFSEPDTNDLKRQEKYDKAIAILKSVQN